MSKKLINGVEVNNTPSEESAFEELIQQHLQRLNERAPFKYVDNRRIAYQKEVAEFKGVESDEIALLGFVVDAILGQIGAAILAGEITPTEEITELLTRFGSVKAKFPKG